MDDRSDRGGSISERLFSTPFERQILWGYRRFFSVSEIEQEPILQIALGALLVSFLLGFSRWFYSHAISATSYIENSYTCWPYFQGCGKLYFLQTLPEGYSQPIVFMGIFAIMAAIGYFMYRKEWTIAHALFIVVVAFKILILFVLTETFAANYDYYDTLLALVILLLPYKLFFARLAFVLFYFLASTIKIHEGWILGTYFTTLSTGLPLFGNTLAPLLTNLVIFMQIVGSWWLLSSNWILQRTALWYFIAFHLFSGILVGFRYPTVALVMLIVLFALEIDRSRQAVPLTRRALAGWYFVAVLFILQFTPIMIPGDQKMTLEGNYYGLFMFEANHQCVSRATLHYADGTTKNITDQSFDSTWRCDPYQYWFQLHNACGRDAKIQNITWTFDHSINGGPFYRIVDVQDACVLSYDAFSHNSWIRLVGSDDVLIVGYPRKNFFQ